jgi:hypothetical protein
MYATWLPERLWVNLVSSADNSLFINTEAWLKMSAHSLVMPPRVVRTIGTQPSGGTPATAIFRAPNSYRLCLQKDFSGVHTIAKLSYHPLNLNINLV